MLPYFFKRLPDYKQFLKWIQSMLYQNFHNVVFVFVTVKVPFCITDKHHTFGLAIQHFTGKKVTKDKSEM